MITVFVFLTNCVCFIIGMSYLVHGVEAIHDLCFRLTSSVNLFRNMSDAREIANFMRAFSKALITHILE